MDDIMLKITNELKLQKKRGSDLAAFLGISKNVITDWKSGRIKSYTKYLHGIAQFLGVSVEYLRGETDIKKAPAQNGEGLQFSLTAHEIELINAYRAKPEMQASIDKLLDIGDSSALAADMAETATLAANHPIGQK